MWQQAILVGLIVVVAVGYSLWALLPAAARLRMARAAADWGRQPGRAAWLAKATGALERTARARLGGCSECSAVQDAPRQPTGRDEH